MKFTCEQSVFNNALAIASKAISPKSFHPVLKNILIEANDVEQFIIITGSDFSFTIKARFNAFVQKAGSICLPHKQLIEIISKTDKGNITASLLETDESKTLLPSKTLSLKTANGVYKLRGLSAADYPELDTVEESQELKFTCKDLLFGCKATLFAASTDTTKQALAGVRIQIDSALEFAATDGHRLAVSEIVLETTASKIAGTIPINSLKEIQQILGNFAPEEIVSVKLDRKFANFKVEGESPLCVSCTSALLEAEYPDYKKLIPTSFNLRGTVNRKSLLSTLMRLEIISEQDRHNIVVMLVEAHKISISATASEVGSAEEVLDIETDGEDSIKFGVNTRYLIEAVKAIPSTDIEICLNAPLSPFIVRPISSEYKITSLLMPIQLKNV